MIARKATSRNLSSLVIGAAWLLSAGCAKSDIAPSSASQAGSSAPSKSVAAVSTARSASVGKARAPVRVMFDRKQGLEPGQSEQIEVTVLPQATLDRLQVDFRGSDGLIVESGAHYTHPGVAAVGMPVLHRIAVSAPTAGRFRVSVIISTSVGGAPIARAIAIPVQIGDVAAVATTHAKSTATADSTGQRIKVLPGVRRTR